MGMNRGTNGGAGDGRPPDPAQPVGNRELIVITREEAGVRAHVSGAESTAGFELGELASVSAESDVVLRPLFGPSEERVRERLAGPFADIASSPAVSDPGRF